MAPSARLAPTAKIPDDAPLAPPTRSVAPLPSTGGVSYAPPSMPPAAPAQQAGLVTRPGGHAAPPRPSGDYQQVPRPSGDYAQVQPQQAPRQYDSIARTQQRPTSSQRPLSQPPQASNASLSFSAPAPRRSIGLIAFVLIVDLGLAGAGAFLLAKGLAKPTRAETAEPPPAPEKKSELTPTGVATPGTAVVSADPAPAPAPVRPFTYP